MIKNLLFLDINRKQLEGNFSQILCSFSDRIFNFYVNDPKNVANGTKIVFEFEEILLISLKNALKNDNINLKFFTKILADYGIVSYKVILFFSFLKFLVFKIIC